MIINIDNYGKRRHEGEQKARITTKRLSKKARCKQSELNSQKMEFQTL